MEIKLTDGQRDVLMQMVGYKREAPADRFRSFVLDHFSTGDPDEIRALGTGDEWKITLTRDSQVVQDLIRVGVVGKLEDFSRDSFSFDLLPEGETYYDEAMKRGNERLGAGGIGLDVQGYRRQTN